jgi:hypothetical protein
VAAIESFPDKHSYGIEAIGISSIRVKEDSPVIEFFTRDH